MVSDEKFVRLLRHPAAKGLSNEAVQQLADAATMIEVDTDEYLHRAEDTLGHIFLVLQGRLKLVTTDLHGGELIQRFLTRGNQFGVLVAAQLEPVPVNVIAVEPTKLLRFDYQTALALGGRHPAFHINLLKLVGDALRQTVFVDRVRPKPATVAVIHQAESTRVITQRLLQRLVELEGSACALSDARQWEPIDGVQHQDVFAAGRLISPEELNQLFAGWANQGRAFVDISTRLDFEEIRRAVNFADRVFWCVEPESYREAAKIISALQTKVDGWRDKINLVWLLNGESRFSPLAPELRDLVAREFKVSTQLHEHAGQQLINGIERIVHELRGIRIGIALGGGAARGMASLGVLKTLEEHGIVVDMIVGTSAGAMTGVAYASGLRADYCVDRFVEDLTPSWLLRKLPKGGHWYLLHKYRSGKFDPMLRKYFQDARLHQLSIPTQTVTVDLVSGEAIVRTNSDAVHGIIESINLPVLSHPIRRPGEALVDGGLINNIPADVLIRNGCNFVIAVSVTARLEKEFAQMRPDSPKVNRRRPSTLQTIMRTYQVQTYNVNAIGVQPADVVIEPDVLDFDLTEFTRTGELAAAGSRATEESIDKIKRLLSQLDPQLFPVAARGSDSEQSQSEDA